MEAGNKFFMMSVKLIEAREASIRARQSIQDGAPGGAVVHIRKAIQELNEVQADLATTFAHEASMLELRLQDLKDKDKTK